MKTRVLHTGDASTRLFAVPFPYLSKTHVKVYVNKFPLNNPHDFKWVGDNAVELRVAPKLKDAIEVARLTTDTTALVQFQNGAVLTEQELNTAILQMLYLLQETRDAYDAALGAGFQRIAGSTAIVGATAEDVINNIVAEVLGDELTAHLQQRITDIDTNAEAILEQRIRVDTVEDLLESIATINGQSIATFLLDEQQARIDGDTALASDISLIGAKSGDGLSFVLDLNKVKVSATEALGTRLNAIQASLGANSAAILSEQTARADGDSANATALTNVTARVATAEGLITTEQTARADADGVLTTRVDGLLATSNNNTALILAEQTARANGDSANASSINTLQTAVNGNTASISTQQAVIDGLSAQYSVKLDVNGHVAGFGLWNSGGSARFTVLADKFAIVTPGQNPVVPFAADASGVYMDTAFIRNLVVDRISGGAISSQWLLNNASGRIVLDTGAHMKVLGVGFGANSDLIEWFGPKMAVASCTKANARTYVGMDGSAYFGGTLSAGTFYNARTTTDSAFGAQISVGPFGSNGGAKTVTCSYIFGNSGVEGGNQLSNYNNKAGNSTVVIYRSISGGGEVEVSRFTASGTSHAEYDNESGSTFWSQHFSGSTTFVDHAGGSSFTYRAVQIARTAIAGSPTTSQSITITSTEG